LELLSEKGKKKDNCHVFLQVECYHFYFTTYIPNRETHSSSILVWHLCYFTASIDVSSTDLLLHTLSLSKKKPPKAEMKIFPEGKKTFGISRLCLFEGMYPNSNKERERSI